MDILIALLSSEAFWGALIALVAVVAGAMPSVGGGRFVVLTRILEGARGIFVKKAAPIVLFALALASAPVAIADDEEPAVGCGGGTCSIYFVSASWPPAVGFNGLEFVRGSLGVGKAGVHAEGDISYLGGLCLVPRVGALLPLCPSSEGQ